MKKLTVLGSVNADHVLQLSHLPKPGETVSSESYQVLGGGKGANQAVAAARMGADITFIACVGSDAIGHQLVDSFASAGINTAGIEQVAGSNTGTAMIFVDANGENCIGISAQANAHLTPDCIQGKKALIETADALLLQLETPVEGVTFAAQVAKNSGTKVILNPAPAAELPDHLLAMVDLITPNETEAERLTGIRVTDEASAARACDVLHGKGIAEVLITLGARGVWYSNAGVGERYSGYSVKAVDTTAAGDCFNGALVAALLKDSAMSDAITFAQAAAALSVTRSGAQDSIPELSEVVAFIEQH
ncbi:ribokinase [Gynuella sunshinyii]|uniref:Ribokinase n=1 Tax=Gynuella sunshinyii YC6258 TaxID=1445510 RepID=A0A0C5VNT6_9GAMM|nr:ribokinase [Gynuella sunshinyii]AJQ95068.1 sugar kinase, ribokinase family [Gynuella sunshinyii YC6258]